MRQIGTVGAFIAGVLLVRCGEADRPRDATQPQPAPAAPAVERVPEPAAASALAPPPPREPTELERVRELVGSLGGPHCGMSALHARQHDLPELLALGESVFWIYEAILAGPNSESGEVVGVCEVLMHLRGDRRQFAPLLARRLAVPDVLIPDAAERVERDRRWVQISLILALEELGEEPHAQVLVPFLDSNDGTLALFAAAGLAKIGGRRELEAMNVWLVNQNPNGRLVAPIRKFRDELELRLLTLVPQ